MSMTTIPRKSVNNFCLRAVALELTAEFAGHHDVRAWVLVRDLGSSVCRWWQVWRLGLTSARRTRRAAHWASWADCLRMVRQRHPDVAELMVTHLQHGATPCFRSVQECKRSLAEAGLQMPPWLELSESPLVQEVVLAAKVRRWSTETTQFIFALADARVQSEPAILRARTAAAWNRRWSALLACSAACAFAVSLVDRRSTPGTGDVIPSAQEVLQDFRFS